MTGLYGTAATCAAEVPRLGSGLEISGIEVVGRDAPASRSAIDGVGASLVADGGEGSAIDRFELVV